MQKSLLAIAISVVLATVASPTFAQAISGATGGAGGAGGTATGGNAAGGVATGGTATNSNNTSGVSNASGGSGGTAQGGSGGSAQGGSAAANTGASTSNALGGNVGTVSTGGSTASLGDVTVNYNLPSGAMGKGGLGVGVDPNTGHVVTDNNVVYSGSYKLKNTPDVNVGGPASGPCNGFSGGMGVSIAGLAIGANASTVDEGCTARETARVAAMIGRMDIANAVLENLPAVQAALRARAARDALINGQGTTAPVKSPVAPDTDLKVKASQQASSNGETEAREALLREQQKAAQEALIRAATMSKVNDTLKFTDAATQNREKTPQQIMAEETSAKLAAKDNQHRDASAQAAVAAQPAEKIVPKPGDAPVANANAATPAVAQVQPGDQSETVKAAAASPAAATESADAPAPEANTGLPSQELQQTSSNDGAKASDSSNAAPSTSLTQASKSSESRLPEANTSATLQPQQLSRLDSQTMTSPLAPQQLVRAEGKSSITGIANAGSPAASSGAVSTADRIRAAKSALGLQ